LSFTELRSSDERLSSGEAVALVLAAISAWERAGGTANCLPSPAELVLSKDGTVSLTGPLSDEATADAGAFFATVLRSLLPLGRASTADSRAGLVPGALLLLVDRASGDSELPRIPLGAFRAGLAQFSTLDQHDLSRVHDRVMRVKPSREATRPAASFGHGRLVSRRSAVVASFVLLILAGCVSALWFVGWGPNAPDRVTVSITYQRAPVVHEPEGTRSNAPAASTLRSDPEQKALAPRPFLSASLVGADVFSPSFARDGQTVWFHAGRRESALMQATFDRTGPPVIAAVVRDGSANYHGTVSPDGQWLAFDSDRDGIRGVYVSRLTGLDARKISGGGYASVPTWSPDARSLAFAKAETARPRVWNVWVVDVETGASRRVSHHRVGQVWGASWFPDATRLAYSVEDTLVVMNLKDGSRHTYRAPQKSGLIRTPAVSPDGTRIIFQLYRDGVWLLDLASGRMRRVLADASAEEFAWSPDGGRVLFHTKRSGAWSVWQLSMERVSAG
jgi:hypothetical protein